MPTNALQPALETAPAAPVSVSVDTARLMEKSLAPKTRKDYAYALDRLAAYLNGQQPTDAALADYLTALHTEGKAPATCAIVVQAVRFLDRLDAGRPPIVGPLTRRTLAGIRREGKGRGKGQVKGLSREAVKLMAHAAQARQTVAGLRDAALMLVMSDALLRIGEAVAIDCEHITREPDGSGRLAIPHSKTDQEGKGAVQYLTPRTLDALDRLLAHPRAAYTKGPLFRRVRRGDWCGPERLTKDGARLLIKAAAQAAGIDGASGHSLRIGTAQELAQRGASLVELQTAGRWQGAAMPAHYTRRQEAGKGAVARLLSED